MSTINLFGYLFITKPVSLPPFLNIVIGYKNERLVKIIVYNKDGNLFKINRAYETSVYK